MYKKLVTVGLIIGVLAVGIAWKEKRVTRLTASHTGPLLTAEEAVARSIGLLPLNHEYHDEVARLSTIGSLLGGSNAATSTAQDMGGYDPASPAWIVAILVENLHVSDMNTMMGFEMSSDPMAQGVLFVWEAGSGSMVAQTFLADLSQYSTIEQMTNMSIVISTTTPPPVLPTYDPTDYNNGSSGSTP